MQLSELIVNVDPLARLGPAIDPEISQITADSREAGRGSLFVAISGELQDGHDYIRDAVSRGAQAVIAERTCDCVGVPVLQVPDSRQALAKVASRFYATPSRSLELIGVTGTVGKTSTTLILKRILEESGQPVGAIGSLGIDTGNSRRESLFTTPDALSLQAVLHEMRANRLERVVMEVSSHALAQDRTYGLLFKTAIFTNLLPLEHSEYHPSFDHYIQTKAKLLAQMDPNGVLVHSADDLHVRKVALSWTRRKLSFGFHPDADVRALDVHTSVQGSTFDVSVANRPDLWKQHTPPRLSIHLPLLGVHNVANALAAIAAGLTLGVTFPQIQWALRKLRPFGRRMEPFKVGEVSVIDDTVGHPYSIDRLFACIEGLGCSSLVLVAAIRGGRGPQINAANAERFAHWYRRLPMRAVWITASHDATMEKDRVTPEEEHAFFQVLQARGVPFAFTPCLAEACSEIAKIVTPEDVVLLAGAQGMDLGARHLQRCLGHNGAKSV